MKTVQVCKPSEDDSDEEAKRKAKKRWARRKVALWAAIHGAIYARGVREYILLGREASLPPFQVQCSPASYLPTALQTDVPDFVVHLNALMWYGPHFVFVAVSRGSVSAELFTFQFTALPSIQKTDSARGILLRFKEWQMHGRPLHDYFWEEQDIVPFVQRLRSQRQADGLSEVSWGDDAGMGLGEDEDTSLAEKVRIVITGHSLLVYGAEGRGAGVRARSIWKVIELLQLRYLLSAEDPDTRNKQLRDLNDFQHYWQQGDDRAVVPYTARHP